MNAIIIWMRLFLDTWQTRLSYLTQYRHILDKRSSHHLTQHDILGYCHPTQYRQILDIQGSHHLTQYRQILDIQGSHHLTQHRQILDERSSHHLTQHDILGYHLLDRQGSHHLTQYRHILDIQGNRHLSQSMQQHKVTVWWKNAMLVAADSGWNEQQSAFTGWPDLAALQENPPLPPLPFFLFLPSPNPPPPPPPPPFFFRSLFFLHLVHSLFIHTTISSPVSELGWSRCPVWMPAVSTTGCHQDRHCQGEMLAAVVCWLLKVPATCYIVYLRDGSAHTILRAATLRQKLQIQLSISPSHSILTPGRPVPALTL